MTKARSVSGRTAKKAAKKPAARPKMSKSPDALVTLFDTTMKAYPDVEQRRVFGYPCGFVNGYMTVGLHGDHLFVRLPPDEQEVFLKRPGAGFLEPMPGRPMRDYVVVPVDLREKKAQLRKWIEKAISYSRSLPPKQKTRR